MNKLKYIFSILLIVWGVLIGFAKTRFAGLEIPYLTITTLICIILTFTKLKNKENYLVIPGFLWILLSFEYLSTSFFLKANLNKAIIISSIPVVLGILLIFSVNMNLKQLNSNIKKVLSIVLISTLGFCSVLYKTHIIEVNSYYYIGENLFLGTFALSPERKFEIEFQIKR